MTPQMLSSRKATATVGLEIEAGGIAAVEVERNGDVHVTRTAIAPLAPGIVKEGEVMDAGALGDALKGLFAEHKLSRVVRLGLANQRIAVRMLTLPLIEKEDELDTAVRFQAQEHIPMPLEQAVLDYQVVARTNDGDGGHMSVVVVAARRDMLEAPLQALRAAGLRPVGLDLSAFGMIRALAKPGRRADDPVPEPGAGAVVYVSLGDATNIALARGDACLFTRIAPFGLEGMAARLAERGGLAVDHARYWLAFVGLAKPIEEIEGDSSTIQVAREVLEDGIVRLADDIRLSLEFYASQEGALPIERVVLCGAGSMIAGVPERIGERLGHSFETMRPPALGRFDDAEAARLTLSYGLALEE
jgi:type IV pilus assembly protein PilM